MKSLRRRHSPTKRSLSRSAWSTSSTTMRARFWRCRAAKVASAREKRELLKNAPSRRGANTTISRVAFSASMARKSPVSERSRMIRRCGSAPEADEFVAVSMCALQSFPTAKTQRHQALFGAIRDVERADEGLHRLAGDAGFPARQFLELFVGLLDPVTTHDRLHRLGQNLPVPVEVFAQAL